MALHPLCPNRIQFAWWALQLFALWGTELPVRHWHWHRQQESGAASAADERPQQWLDHQFAPRQIQANWAGRLASPRTTQPPTNYPQPSTTHHPPPVEPSAFILQSKARPAHCRFVCATVNTGNEWNGICLACWWRLRVALGNLLHSTCDPDELPSPIHRPSPSAINCCLLWRW